MTNYKIIKIIVLFLFLQLFCYKINAQQFGMGLLLDDSLYSNRPVAAPLMRGDYNDLPKSFSLKKYSPSPGNQGPYGTCAGWSTAYSARTIVEAIKNNWNDSIINSNAFSPSFVYNQIRLTNDCNSGTSLIQALDVLKNEGGLKMNDFVYDCEKEVTAVDKANAKKYKIIEYRDVIPENSGLKYKYVKKSIAEKRPVVVAFDCPDSFLHSKEIWLPDSSDYKEWSRGHALTVIGYDDEKYGGAFEVINSWGDNWGQNGYAWIRYMDFDFFCKFAFEVIDKSKTNLNTPDLSGKLLFKTAGGEKMKASFNGEYFVMEKSYPSGTLFELHFSNNEPAYVYAFSSDLTYKTFKLFPFNKRMLAYLPYSENNVAIPDEESYNILDQNKGKSYFCFLYSKSELNIEQLMQKVENSNGSIWERITKALGTNKIDSQNITFSSEDEIKFSAMSRDKSVVPIVIEITHI